GRLIEFGSNEHFELWKQGFDVVFHRARRNGAPVVLLDIAWAEVFDGQPLPRGARAIIRSVGRRARRGARQMSRSLARCKPLSSSLEKLVSPDPTQAENLSAVSRKANKDSRRYVLHMASKVDSIITRTADTVRMDSGHRWGIGPYHYRNADYKSIAEEARPLLKGQDVGE